MRLSEFGYLIKFIGLLAPMPDSGPLVRTVTQTSAFRTTGVLQLACISQVQIRDLIL